MVYKWHGLFKHSTTFIEDDLRPGRPAEVIASQTIEKAEKIVLVDALLNKKQLSALVGVSDTTILRILQDHLQVSARWVHRILTSSSSQQQ